MLEKQHTVAIQRNKMCMLCYCRLL